MVLCYGLIKGSVIGVIKEVYNRVKYLLRFQVWVSHATVLLFAELFQ